MSSSFHIVFISMLWNSSFPASVKIICGAASVLPFIFCMWSSMLPLLFMVISRYLYVLFFFPVLAWSPIVISVFGVFPLMVIDWLFSFPNLMWYLFASSLVVFNIFLSSSLSWWIRATSSIHSRHPGIMLFHSFWFPMVSSCSSFDKSSITLGLHIQ